MKKLRKSTGQKVQYTLTILPEFLQSYSRIRTHQILQAIEYYVKTDNSNYSEAAARMNCINPLSFRIYYIRFLKVLDKWIMFIVEHTLIIGGSIDQEKLTEPAVEIREKMDIYDKHARLYFIRYEKMPGSERIADKPGYLHTLYCRNQMDLGP